MLTILLFLLGLIIGSFLGAFTYRYPRKISIKKGRSFCPNCKNTISWFDNIPLLSYFLLRGKCRSCQKKISVRYPLIELSTAVIFVLVGADVFLLIISALLIAVFVIDWEQMLIPDELVFGGLAIFLGYSLLFNDHLLFSNLLAGVSASLLLLLIHAITRGRGMGLGDVKLAILGGSILGPRLSVVWFFASFLTGGVVAAILLLSKKAKLKQKIAFGPFLVAGFFIAKALEIAKAFDIAWLGLKIFSFPRF